MKIPKKLKIGGHIFNIVYPYRFRERGDLTGQYDWEAQSIKISDRDGWSHDKLPESTIAVTLLHELLHCADKVSGHTIFQENEKAIEGISEALFQIIIDNKLDFRNKGGP